MDNLFLRKYRLSDYVIRQGDGNAVGDVKSLFALVASAMDEFTDEYDEETVITATAVNEKSEKLFSQLFPDAEGSYMIRGRLYKEM